ncbi:arylesterase [Sphingobium sp. CR28]|uniref:arylesterase n=1 Tax=Sphingobium sp. CR28 TaxID=3400272 RepID=UPI003FEFB7FA
MARGWQAYVLGALALQSLSACSGEPGANQVVNRTEAGSENVAREAAPQQAQGKLILAFGDSLYAGYGVAQNESFPHELQQALKSAGVTADVRNAGVSGETTQGGLERLDFTLDGLPRRPDLVLLGLGGNDMLRGIDPARTDANLRQMLDKLRARNIPVMLTGMLAAPNMGPDYATRFNAIYPALAKDYEVPLYPFFLEGVIGDTKLMQADTVHPNAAGVDVVVKRIAPQVRAALEKANAGRNESAS